MNENVPITIVVASDNHYAILIAGLLKSIEVNHVTEEHILFYIINDNISNNFKKKLEKIVDSSKITIKWFDKKNVIPPNTTIPADSSTFPSTVYMRIFSPNIVDENTDKLIYLDVDTILQEDISRLWNIPLGEHIVGAVQDIGKTVDCDWAGIPNYLELGLEPKTKYFNSGVLLINVRKWNLENISEKVISTSIKYKQHLKFADQYGLNIVLLNKWLEIDPRWNWFAAVEENEKPFLIHFLTIKPIFKSYNSQESYKNLFYYYLSMTPWKDFKPISGNRRNIRKIINRIKKVFVRIHNRF